MSGAVALRLTMVEHSDILLPMSKQKRGKQPVAKVVGFRVLPEVFAAADKRAKADGFEVSEILRSLLNDYSAGLIAVQRREPIITRRVEQ